METKTCVSCKRANENDRSAAGFSCPACDAEITRCGACRKGSVAYTCKCGFEGP